MIDIDIKTWNERVAVLEDFFRDRKLPPAPIQLSPGVVITNPARFVNANLEVVHSNRGNNTYQPYMIQLRKFMKYCIENGY